MNEFNPGQFCRRYCSGCSSDDDTNPNDKNHRQSFRTRSQHELGSDYNNEDVAAAILILAVHRAQISCYYVFQDLKRSEIAE